MTTSEIRKARWSASFALFVAPSESSRSLIVLVVRSGADAGRRLGSVNAVAVLCLVFGVFDTNIVANKTQLKAAQKRMVRENENNGVQPAGLT